MKQSSSTFNKSHMNFSVKLLTIVAVFAISCMLGASASADTAISGSHIVTATTRGQGDISPAGTLPVAEGSSRPFVFDTDENHRMVDLIVDGVSIGPVDAFSFENISASHTIEAVFESDATLAEASETGF